MPLWAFIIKFNKIFTRYGQCHWALYNNIRSPNGVSQNRERLTMNIAGVLLIISISGFITNPSNQRRPMPLPANQVVHLVLGCPKFIFQSTTWASQAGN